MNRLARWRTKPQIDRAWVGVMGVIGVLIALLIIPSWQNTTITNLRERTLNISKFIDDSNELEVALQDMRLAVRGYIISKNGFFSQQYVDASTRQNSSIERLTEDALLIHDLVHPDQISALGTAIDDWRSMRLDHQVALVDAGDIAGAEADFSLSIKQHSFDNIRKKLVPLQTIAKNELLVVQAETVRVHATNFLVNTVLTCLALGALVIVLLGVIRQTRLLDALQLAKSESNELTIALSMRLDELHHQNERLATAQLIMARAMQISRNTSHMQRIVQTIQQTLQVPLVALWHDVDMLTHPIVVCNASADHDTIQNFPATLGHTVLADLFVVHRPVSPLRIAYDDTHAFVLYPLITSGHTVGVLGLLLTETANIDSLVLQQITMVVDNFQLFQQLQLEQQRLRILFDVVPLGFVLVDAQGMVLIKNQRAEQFIPQLTTTTDCKEALGQTTFFGMGGYILQTPELPLMVALAQDTVGTHDIMHELAGVRVPVRHQVVAIYDGDSINGYVLVLEDLREAYELDRLKADFVSMVSHELRTPLAAIVGATTMLVNSGATSPRDTQHDMLLLIQSQGQRLQSLIEDILNLARIDRDGVRLQRDIVDPLTMVRRVVGQNAQIKRRVRITTKGVIPNVWVDGARIEQVINNILDNAEKYAPHGEIEISLAVRATMPPMVACVVRDYGTALSEIEYQRVFDRFFQVQQRSSHGGVGLGLAICKYFVEAHGGSISMQASPNNDGTVVEFTMPLAESAHTVVPYDTGSIYRVLLIEDDTAMQRIMHQMLDTHHFDVVAVGTVFHAQEKITRGQFDLLIVDVMLPDGSGLDFVREVRQWLDVPIMVVTARGSEQDVLTGLRAGVDDYMVKPFNYEEFVLRVQALCRRNHGFDAKEATVAIGDLQISFADKQLSINSQKIEVTPIEYRMLRYLMRHVGQILSHEQILQGVWGERYDQENQYLWVHISHVRRKLQAANITRLTIENVRGIGYRLVYSAPPV
jgi:two-component system, OmpR family, KDP operon response regulator KdpE